jgi:hypothetical protein
MGRANAIRPYNNLLIQNEDFLSNPINPVNPDSKPSVRDKFHYNTYRKNLISVGENPIYYLVKYKIQYQ